MSQQKDLLKKREKSKKDRKETSIRQQSEESGTDRKSSGIPQKRTGIPAS